MAYRHLAVPEIRSNKIKVKLVIGMASEGVSLPNHEMLSQLEGNDPINCYYRIESPPTHSKVYVWMSSKTPIRAYVGSSNYTEQGFLAGRQGNVMTEESDPQSAYSYFREILHGTMEIKHDDIEQHVRFYRNEQDSSHAADHISVSLLSTRGRWKDDVPPRSGLNWGQRPEYRRNPNQAYIQIGAELARSGFFPPKPTWFTVHTDDGLNLTVVRAQKDTDGRGGDALETPEGNHILGAYFRARLGVQSGKRIVKQDMESYGRTNVDFWQLDDGEFFMDFSV